MDSTSQHPSRFQLECWILEKKTDPKLEAHTASCAACRSTVEEIQNETQAFLVKHPFTSFNARIEERARGASKKSFFAGAWLLKVAPLGVMAALALFMIRVYDPQGDVRYKGAVELGYYIQAGGEAVKGPKTGPARAGDLIRLYLQTQKENSVVIAGIEEGGKITVYYPDQAAVGATVPKGQLYLFPDSIQLDDSPNDELFVAVFSKKQLPVAQIQDEIAAQYQTLQSQGKTLKDWNPGLLKHPNDYFYLDKQSD